MTIRDGDVRQTLIPQLRRVISVAKRLVARVPGPIGDTIHSTARTVRNKRRDQHRAQVEHDGAYFDEIVDRAIAEGSHR